MPPPKKIRIAYYIESQAVGGAERSTGLLVRSLDHTRYEPFVFCSVDPVIKPAIKDWEAAGACVVRDPHIFIHGKRSFKDVWHLSRLFRRYQLDLLHIQMLTGECRTAILAGKLARIPVVMLTQRGYALENSSRLRRLLSQRLVGLLDVVTANSRDTRQLLIEKMNWPPEKIQVVYNGIDVQKFSPQDTGEAKRRLGLPPAAPVIVATGRLERLKGHAFVIQAMPAILKSHPHAVFVLAGAGDEAAALQRLAVDLGVEGAVRLLGFRTDIPELTAAADVCVVPSLIEPFGLTVAEAMAMEKPVVASRVNGIPEVLGDDGRAGTLVPPSNPEALALAILHYLNDPVSATTSGLQGRQRVLACFNLERLGQNFEDIYQRFLTAKQVTPV